MKSIVPAATWPSISVIMPCFNAECFIKEALRSVVEQQYPGELEILVVDDGSTDGSVAIAQAFDQVTVLSQKNQGPAAARNLALEHARGEVVAFLDADDLWTPGSLQSRVDRLLKEPAVGVVFGDFSYWRSENPSDSIQSDEPCLLPESVRKAVREGWVYPEILLDPIVHIIATVVRRSVIDTIGVFDRTLRTGEDYDFFIRAARHCQFSHVESVVARYRLHASSITRTPQPKSNEYTVVSQAIKCYGTAGLDGRQLDEKLLEQRMQRMCFDHALSHLHHGDPRIAKSGFWAAIKHYPWRMKSWLFLATAWLKSVFSLNAGVQVRKP